MRVAALGMITMLAGLPGAGATNGARASEPGHRVVVKMVDVGGGQYRFAPAAVTVARGDTVQWLEASGAPHNVQFDSWPHGAKLGSAQTGPLLATRGSAYELVIDGRFPAGTYAYECTPHGPLGMKATLTVAAGG